MLIAVVGQMTHEDPEVDVRGPFLLEGWTDPAPVQIKGNGDLGDARGRVRFSPVQVASVERKDSAVIWVEPMAPFASIGQSIQSMGGMKGKGNVLQNRKCIDAHWM